MITPGHRRQPTTWRIRDRSLSTADHTLIMGILNVTPDSFSDGGRFVSPAGVDAAAAVAAGLRLWADGADIVDVGGESTRPGARPVAEEVEIERTVPVVRALAAAGVTVSIDTSKPEVAAAALDAGAAIVNDVTGLRDPRMIGVCADAGSGVVVMHMRGDPATMQDDPRYDDVVGEVRAYLVAAVEGSGLDPETVCLDPGIGFGKTQEHNLALLGQLEAFVSLGYPVLLGTSRKGFLARILQDSGFVDPSLEQRDRATAATTALAIAAGVAAVRVHDVAAAVGVARTADAIVRSRTGSEEQASWRG